MIEKRFTQGPAKKKYKKDRWRGWRREMGGRGGSKTCQIEGGVVEKQKRKGV